MTQERVNIEIKNDGEDYFQIKINGNGNFVRIENTFSELFPMWVGRILITAATKEWALMSAKGAVGFASSIIMSPAEAGIEGTVSPNETPDRRPGVLIQMYHRLGNLLKAQMMLRIGQCVMTCPTTAVFDGMGESRVKRLKTGKSLSLFGDGYQIRDTLVGRRVWRIPVMDGEFISEERFGVKRGVAGGMFLIMTEESKAG
ncbi:MAG: formylmethanofuran--tetrahydromethanopterin N-formyltransferase, partial [Thermoproteota archaeon]|nr:formylmethanofuran--tetrahydromethanopterin N-formyltransferase [Thermoproteota archaeon]